MPRLIPLVLFALTACRPGSTTPAADITLEASPDRVGVGDSVRLVLRTTLAGGVGYNLCHSPFERQAGDTWEQVPAEWMCTMEMRRLLPGDSAVFLAPVGPSMRPPGRYRAATRVERPGDAGMVRVTSEPFEVR
jgi:hypothetical protein